MFRDRDERNLSRILRVQLILNVKLIERELLANECEMFSLQPSVLPKPLRALMNANESTATRWKISNSSTGCWYGIHDRLTMWMRAEHHRNTPRPTNAECNQWTAFVEWENVHGFWGTKIHVHYAMTEANANRMMHMRRQSQNHSRQNCFEPIDPLTWLSS